MQRTTALCRPADSDQECLSSWSIIKMDPRAWDMLSSRSMGCCSTCHIFCRLVISYCIPADTLNCDISSMLTSTSAALATRAYSCTVCVLLQIVSRPRIDAGTSDTEEPLLPALLHRKLAALLGRSFVVPPLFGTAFCRPVRLKGYVPTVNMSP